MKRISLLLMFCSVVMFAKATVIVDELFDYNVSKLTDETTWQHQPGTVTAGTGRTLLSGGLEYSNAGGTYIFSGIGKTMKSDVKTTGNDPTLAFISYRALPYGPINSGDIYLSFLYKANGAQTQPGTDIIGLGTTSAQTTFRAYAARLADGTTNPFRIGVNNSTAGSTTAYPTTEFEKDIVYLIVVKYNFDTQLGSMFFNPVIATASEPTPDAITTARAITSFENLMFYTTGNGATANFFISGIRVATTWEEAVASRPTAAPLATPNVGVASDIAAESCTANWTPVANAMGYDVEVYMGASLFKTINVTGQSAASCTLSGLAPGITYTYKVIAKGDITNYAHSAPSAASAEFTTLNPYITNAIHTDFGDGTWGDVAPKLPNYGSFGSYSFNGFILEAAVVLVGNTNCNDGGPKHINRIALDRVAYGGKIFLPTLTAVEQIEIHAYTSSTNNAFKLTEFNESTNTWDIVGNPLKYEGDRKQDSIFIVSVSRTSPTKFRIESTTSVVTYITQIITRTTNPTRLATPTVGAASNVMSDFFTANWTAVPNASGYRVGLYKKTITLDPITSAEIISYPLDKTLDVSGQATENYQVNELEGGTEYYYKVQAVGDGFIDHADSFYSTTSEKFTTLPTGLDNVSTSKLTVAGKTITASEIGTFDVYNLQGARVFYIKNANTVNTNLAKGLYILQYTDLKGKKLSQKITIN